MTLFPAFILSGIASAESAESPDGLINQYGFVGGILITAALWAIVLFGLYVRDRYIRRR